MATLNMGPGTYVIPVKMFKENRNRVIAALRNIPGFNRAFIFLEGGSEVPFNDTDIDYMFRQESYFQYMFGVREPGCYGAIAVATGKTYLFIPRLHEDYAVWMGALPSPDEFTQRYEVEDVYYRDELPDFFAKSDPKVILTLCGINSDSGLLAKPATFPGMDKFHSDSVILHKVIAECRVTKSPEEIAVLRYVASVSSEAHKVVMKTIKPNMKEYQGESAFMHYCYTEGGCRQVSYTCICGSGVNSSILHYGHAAAPNERVIRDGDMCLFDMGANYFGYAADITCSFPVNGKFTDDQKFIYNAVLAARNAVLKEVKAGVSWVDMHKLANRVLLEHLTEGGMFVGDVSDMLDAGLGAILQPHGLGHLIGLDVHDVGGYLEGQPERPAEPGLNKLRFARILLENMYVTVEPGCYFISCLMDKALSDPKMKKFINVSVFERFRSFGGVRIEDDVWVKKDGCENFAIVPRTVEEIENFMKSK